MDRYKVRLDIYHTKPSVKKKNQLKERKMLRSFSDNMTLTIELHKVGQSDWVLLVDMGLEIRREGAVPVSDLDVDPLDGLERGDGKVSDEGVGVGAVVSLLGMGQLVSELLEPVGPVLLPRVLHPLLRVRL
jgi:hypothetical protein